MNRPIVFIGPVGAGKTTLAQTTHELSGRNGPFVVVSAGELTETLYADALFGHVSGAYTGAQRERSGSFAEAGIGTLLIDDLVLMPRAAQSALLRVIESGRYRPLGAGRDEVARCRLLVATTVAPAVLGARGDLLPDLASRLGELTVPVPPLQQRRSDIPWLARTAAEALLREHGLSGQIEFTVECLAALRAFDWPANIRELRAVVERCVIHAGMSEPVIRVGLQHLPDRIRLFQGSEQAEANLTSGLVQTVLKETGGNRSEAARRLGVHRNTIARYVKDAG